MSLLPGYVATITVSGVAYHPTTNTASLTQSADIMDKTKLGQRRRTKLRGLGDASFTLGLHMDTDTMAAMMAAYESIDAVPVVMRPGALGEFDVGQWAGDGFVSNMTWDGTADGEFDVGMDIDMTNGYVYTQPV